MLPSLGRKSPEGGWRGRIRAKGPEGILQTQEVRLTRNENTGGHLFPEK